MYLPRIRSGAGRSGLAITGESAEVAYSMGSPTGANEVHPVGRGGSAATPSRNEVSRHVVSHFRRGPPMMAKTVLDLLHSLGVDDADIRFDNFGG